MTILLFYLMHANYKLLQKVQKMLESLSVVLHVSLRIHSILVIKI